MKHKHPLFTVGLAGLLVTLALQLSFVATGVADFRATLPLWSSCYSVWLALLIIGWALRRGSGRASGAPR